MPKPALPRFSSRTLDFIEKASRQKNPDWLKLHRGEYETLLLEPLQHLAKTLRAKLGKLAPDYHFPQKGIGRLKRTADKAKEHGSFFKDWVSYNATRPSKSRFDHNPNLYFLLQAHEPEGDHVLIAGGFYMPSSKQTRAIREAIAADAAPFEKLFASKPFASRFPGGFSLEKSATRPPRGFDPNHPKLKWLKLQGFFVWKPYSMKTFSSPDFAERVAEDCAQILRLNALLDRAVRQNWTQPRWEKKTETRPVSLDRKYGDIQAPRYEMDF